MGGATDNTLLKDTEHTSLPSSAFRRGGHKAGGQVAHRRSFTRRLFPLAVDCRDGINREVLFPKCPVSGGGVEPLWVEEKSMVRDDGARFSCLYA
jgi:hypothetical protein